MYCVLNMGSPLSEVPLYTTVVASIKPKRYRSNLMLYPHVDQGSFPRSQQ